MACSNLYLQLKGLSADKFDRLLEILSQTANLLSALQKNSSYSGLDRENANTLLQQSTYNEGQLLTWFHELQSEKGTQPLFFFHAQNMSVDTLEIPQETISFTNPSTIPLLLLYWLGLVAVYASMVKALHILVRTDERTCLKKKLETAELLCYRFANRLSQCHTGCVGMGRGTTILSMATSLAAQQIRQGLQDNCLVVELEDL
jgi:hypothetical protein